MSRTTERPSPPRLDETLTREHLEAALRDEATAAVECAWFARIAEIEGEPELARALREIGEQHVLNAKGGLDLLLRAREPLTGRPAGGSADNVSALSAFYLGDAEVQEGRARTARNEGFADISSWFTSLARLRAAHGARLRALQSKGEP